MKKFIALFLMGAMVLSMAGCSGSSMNVMDGGYSGSLKAEGVYGGLLDGPAAAAPMEGADSGEAQGNSQDIPFAAGTLTAGEWNDAEDLVFWKELLNRNDWYQLMENWNLYTNSVVRAFVHDGAGKPCYGVPVALCAEDGTVLYEAITGVNGYANLLYNLQKEGLAAVSVQVNGVLYPITDGKADIRAEDAGLPVKQLDLMLMIDTTGSMGDELRYLQTELEDVIARVAEAGEALSIHVSVNFYRDEDDEYVVRNFEFTGDIASAVSKLKAQDANGGGDYPEAVHKALDSIVNQHQWRKDAVKLCFFVLDAPPHSEQEIQGINAQMRSTVADAAKAGIRIIPVASSGVNTDTEFLLRSWALMTGGTYTFLTDHSGIGNDHLEPTIGQYQVEALNECLIRLICEYCGLPYSAPFKDQ